MGCCLIVANRSMAGRRLREKLLTLHLEDPTTEFHVVVPARGLEFYDLAWASGFGMPSPVASALETIGIAPTQARLDAMLADQGGKDDTGAAYPNLTEFWSYSSPAIATLCPSP